MPTEGDKTIENFNLDLSKMPPHLTPGEYGTAVVNNMSTYRFCSKYEYNVIPIISWSTLIDHTNVYGVFNGWREDGAESAVMAILEKVADIENSYWTMDLIEWPFSGDRPFLTWCERVVDSQMSCKIRTTKKEFTAINGNACTQLGRWFAQRPQLLKLSLDVIDQLVQYVDTVDSMSNAAFKSFIDQPNSNSVMQREKSKSDVLFKQTLVRVLDQPRKKIWSEQAFRDFVLGFSWSLRAKGNPDVFEKMAKLLNRNNQHLSHAQRALCMQDKRWVAGTMAEVVTEAQSGLVTLVRKSTLPSMDAFYQGTFHQADTKKQYANVALLARTNSAWSHAMYKMVLASSFRDYFNSNYGSMHNSFMRLQSAAPMLDAMDKHERDALFSEFTQALPQMETMFPNRMHENDNAWSRYTQQFFETWAMDQQEEDNTSCTAWTTFMSWLEAWQHPYQNDVQLISVIAGDCAFIGNWLTDTVASKQRMTKNGLDENEDLHIELHQLL